MSRESHLLQTMLMVEDNLDHAELIRRSLERHELVCRIVHVTDGDSALDYLLSIDGADRGAGAAPDLILLDIRLPKRSGIDVLRAIRERPGLADIPVVILTTSANLDDIREAHQLHVNSYLVKPFVFEEFRSLLDDLGLHLSFGNDR